MKIRTLTLVFACAVGVSFGLLGVPAASAITFTFNVPSGPLGTTQNYGTAPFNVTAAGFSSAAQLATGVPNVNLFGKDLGADENGLGLVNDPTGEDEIAGTSLIRIAMGAGLTAPAFAMMDSVTGSDAWLISGSNSATTGFVPLLAGNDEASHMIPFFSFYTFQATAGNVLLGSITAQAVPAPIVGAGLPGLVAACGALIALARRRRQRVA